MKKFVKYLFLLLTLVSFLGVGFGIGRMYDPKGEIVTASEGTSDLRLIGEVERRVITAEEVQVKLSDLGEFSTYLGEYSVCKAADYNRYLLDDIRILGTENSVSVSCDGVVKVGFDVNSIRVSVDNESSTIYVDVPETEVLDNYILWETLHVEESNNFLNPIDFEQYYEMISELQKLGLEQVLEADILSKATDNSTKLIEGFLSCFEEYDIVFL